MSTQTEAGDHGLRERWAAGDSAYFEYHCQESMDSADADLWLRSHQVVMVTASGTGDGWTVMPDSTFAERAEVGLPRTYAVRWPDGHTGDVFEDELLTGPEHYYRPDPPSRP